MRRLESGNPDLYVHVRSRSHHRVEWLRTFAFPVLFVLFLKGVSCMAIRSDKPATVVYEVYGRKYIFENVRIEAGVMYGFCRKKKKWAWMNKDAIMFDGESPVPARRIG